MVLTRKVIPILFLTALFLTVPVSAEFESESLPEKLATPVKNFLEADTAAARSGMAAFSDEDLQKIVNAFKKSHSSADQRLFWLIEESYRRNAERVAAERIRYLYYAVLAALGIIGLFAALTYARSRRSASPSAAAPQVTHEPVRPVVAATKRNKKRH